MKPSVALTLIAFALPALGAAQSATTPTVKDNKPVVTYTATMDSAGNKITFSAVIQYPSCPVALQAKQGSGSGLVMVKRSDPSKDPNEQKPSFRPTGHIHLILSRLGNTELDIEQVERATITARGLSARSRIDRTPAALGNAAPDLRRTQDVWFNRDSDGTLYVDLDLPGFTSVQSIRIDKLELKDGSTWSLDSRQGCVVVPDPLMLIASQFGYQPAN